MQEEQVDQQAEATEEPAGGAEGATGGSGDSELAATVDQQAAASDGAAAEAAPEVPDDAGDKIARAQEHINKLDMDEERAAAKRAI